MCTLRFIIKDYFLKFSKNLRPIINQAKLKKIFHPQYPFILYHGKIISSPSLYESKLSNASLNVRKVPIGFTRLLNSQDAIIS